MICTVGIAWSSVHCAVVWLFHSRQPMPATATANAATSAILPYRFRPGGAECRSKGDGAGLFPASATGPASGFLSGICLSRLGGTPRVGRCLGRVAAMDDAEHHRHE